MRKLFLILTMPVNLMAMNLDDKPRQPADDFMPHERIISMSEFEAVVHRGIKQFYHGGGNMPPLPNIPQILNIASDPQNQQLFKALYNRDYSAAYRLKNPEKHNQAKEDEYVHNMQQVEIAVKQASREIAEKAK